MRSLLLLPLILIGCASPNPGALQVPGQKPTTITDSGSSTDVSVSTSRAVVMDVVSATPEAAWAALHQAWAFLGMEPAGVSEASRTLETGQVTRSRQLAGTPLSKYLECGTGLQGPFADRYRVQMYVRSSIVPEDGGGVRVATYLEASARNPEGSSNSTIACASTQRLEREIAEQVRLRTQGR